MALPENEHPPYMGRLVSSTEAIPAQGQHRAPCSDCPWSRASLPGWLGGTSADEWLLYAHSNTQVDCHTLYGAQCAGMAIYRANVLKRTEPPLLRLPMDREKVFATSNEFKEHHSDESKSAFYRGRGKRAKE